MKNLLLVCLALSLAGCLGESRDLAVGDCVVDRGEVFQVLKVGEISYQLVSENGKILTTAPGYMSYWNNQRVDCFNSFDTRKVK